MHQLYRNLNMPPNNQTTLLSLFSFISYYKLSLNFLFFTIYKTFYSYTWKANGQKNIHDAFLSATKQYSFLRLVCIPRKRRIRKCFRIDLLPGQFDTRYFVERLKTIDHAYTLVFLLDFSGAIHGDIILK